MNNPPQTNKIGRFGENAGPVLQQSIEVLKERAGQYGDTWECCEWLALRSVAEKMTLYISKEEARRLAAAAFVDMKYWRMMGPYKEDTLVDLINYSANLAGEMQCLHKNPQE